MVRLPKVAAASASGPNRLIRIYQPAALSSRVAFDLTALIIDSGLFAAATTE